MIADERQLEGDIRELAGLEISAQKSRGWWTATVYVAANTSLGQVGCHGKSDRTFMGAVRKAIEAAKRHLRANPMLQA